MDESVLINPNIAIYLITIDFYVFDIMGLCYQLRNLRTPMLYSNKWVRIIPANDMVHAGKQWHAYANCTQQNIYSTYIYIYKHNKTAPVLLTRWRCTIRTWKVKKIDLFYYSILSCASDNDMTWAAWRPKSLEIWLILKTCFMLPTTEIPHY